MTKLTLFFLIQLFFVQIISAQKLPAFGKVDVEELQNNTCSYYPEANAEVLIDEGDTRFDWSSKNFFKMFTYRRVRIKILTQQGLEYANIKLKYLSDENYERITDVQGRTYNLENNKVEITKLEKKLTYNQKINDQQSELSFSFPNVKVGSIIEYKYTIDKESFRNIDPWVFQKEIPIRISRFNLQTPEYFRFATKTLVSVPLKREESTEQKNIPVEGTMLKFLATNYQYTLNNIKPLLKEPFMTSFKDYLQRLEFQLSEIVLPNNSYSFNTTWEELAKELRESSLFGMQLKKNVDMPELDAAIKLITDNNEKIKYIYTYFKNNFTCNNIEDFYCVDVKKVNTNKTGTTGDINLLFLNKLKEYKIESYPILISTKENGTVNTIYPFLKQFNTVMAYIPMDDKFYIINAADKYNSYNLIPYDAVNTKGLKILKDNSTWINLFDEKMIEKQIVSYKMDINEDGLINGNTYINSQGYNKPPRLEMLKTNPSSFEKKYYVNEANDLKIMNLKLRNETTDSLGLEQEFEFKKTLEKNGDYYLLHYNLFTNFSENPFVALNRFADIDFNYSRQISLNANISISQKFEFEELPKSFKFIMPDTGIIFERRIIRDENVLSISFSFKILQLNYTASDYEDVKEFYKELFSKLEEPIVLRIKK